MIHQVQGVAGVLINLLKNIRDGDLEGRAGAGTGGAGGPGKVFTMHGWKSGHKIFKQVSCSPHRALKKGTVRGNSSSRRVRLVPKAQSPSLGSGNW